MATVALSPNCHFWKKWQSIWRQSPYRQSLIIPSLRNIILYQNSKKYDFPFAGVLFRILLEYWFLCINMFQNFAPKKAGTGFLGFRFFPTLSTAQTHKPQQGWMMSCKKRIQKVRQCINLKSHSSGGAPHRPWHNVDSERGQVHLGFASVYLPPSSSTLRWSCTR